MYLLHPRYATDPRHYVRGFLLLQDDMLDLFSYIEPSDSNLQTYSHRIQQLLMRCCVEIEANLTAILLDNEFGPAKGNLTIPQYHLVESSHRLSAYEVRVPGWKGIRGLRRPFENWRTDHSLSWYQAYNKSKHNRHENFKLATFDALIDAYCGLNVLLSAQFYDEDYSSSNKSIAVSGACYFYEGDDGMEPSIGDRLRIRFPTDWPSEHRYEFNWHELSALRDPFKNFDYAQIAAQRRLLDQSR